MRKKLYTFAFVAAIAALAGAGQISAQGGPPSGQEARICILLGILGVQNLPPFCDDAEEEIGPLQKAVPAADACPGHPGVRPRPGFSQVEFDEDRNIFVVTTPPTTFEPSSSDDELPTNLCPTVYENARSASGAEIPNTLPSTPDNPYNLHPEPTVTPIDKRSPRTDLEAVLRAMRAALAAGEAPDPADIDFAIDILEGNPIDRVYSGMPLLHYNGPNKIKQVQPVFDEDGNKIGGHVEVNQVWFDGRIMADTALLDPSQVQDVTWTMTVNANTLENGHEDFAPFQIYFDDPLEMVSPAGTPVPHIAMDQSFFPMEDGYKTTFEMKQAPGRFFNLNYFWGWRIHPPRVQVIENALKRAGMAPNPADNPSLLEWEQIVFGEDPQASEEAKLQAISMIGDLAPAKRMWNILRALRDDPASADEATVEQLAEAFYDWRDRLSLPSGIEFDEDFDVNVIYLNNTIYGQVKGQGNWEQRVEFNQPGDMVRIKVMNGDYFPHAYQFVDFGGNRGWENTYHSTAEIGGAGPWFTFGRAHWWPMLAPALIVPPATPAEGSETMVQTIDQQLQWSMAADRVTASSNKLGKIQKDQYHYGLEWLQLGQSPSVLTEFQQVQDVASTTIGVLPVEFHMNHIPSKRLKIYQFDPLHHDVAVWSIH